MNNTVKLIIAAVVLIGLFVGAQHFLLNSGGTHVCSPGDG